MDSSSSASTTSKLQISENWIPFWTPCLLEYASLPSQVRTPGQISYLGIDCLHVSTQWALLESTITVAELKGCDLLDVCILIDSSGSIRDSNPEDESYDNWAIVLNFVKQVRTWQNKGIETRVHGCLSVAETLLRN